MMDITSGATWGLLTLFGCLAALGTWLVRSCADTWGDEKPYLCQARAWCIALACGFVFSIGGFFWEIGGFTEPLCRDCLIMCLVTGSCLLAWLSYERSFALAWAPDDAGQRWEMRIWLWVRDFSVLVVGATLLLSGSLACSLASLS